MGKVFQEIFPTYKNSETFKRKCDTVFQIMHTLIHNARKKTPLHVAIAETRHDTCRSKKLINIMNHLGICISYDDMERIDTSLANRIITEAGEHRVPVAESIKSSSVIHGAMDNFDHDENSLTGIGGSHDTVLMLLQNTDEQIENENDDVNNISVIPDNIQNSHNNRALEHILPCQLIAKAGKPGKRGEIPNNFQTGDFNDTMKEPSRRNFLIWAAARSNDLTSAAESKQVPSFTATNSLLSKKVKSITKFAFTPVVSHPATEFDIIFTCMKNFEDVLLQRNLDYGPLRCDEGVHRIAKEIQLLNPGTFNNIFLGLGGFHMEKFIIACCGIFLKGTGIDSVLVESTAFGSGVVNSVMSGGNYIRGKRGMVLIAEALQQLKQTCESTNWKHHENSMNDFLICLDAFIKDASKKSSQFKF